MENLDEHEIQLNVETLLENPHYTHSKRLTQNEANYCHIFWLCLLWNPFWQEVHKVLQKNRNPIYIGEPLYDCPSLRKCELWFQIVIFHMLNYTYIFMMERITGSTYQYLCISIKYLHLYTFILVFLMPFNFFDLFTFV